MPGGQSGRSRLNDILRRMPLGQSWTAPVLPTTVGPLPFREPMPAPPTLPESHSNNHVYNKTARKAPGCFLSICS